MTVSAKDVRLTDGRTLRTYDSGGDGLAVLWHHGSPQTGALLEPLLAAAAERGLRLFSYGRPSYGGSSPQPGRNVASAAGDVAQIADALGIERFATMGASGGGPHALACAALLPDRVIAVACFASPSPYTEEFDWYEGMASDGGLRAAALGREARLRYAETAEFDPTSFTDADWATLSGAWSVLGDDAQKAGSDGPDGLVDDDVAFASPWGFDPATITAPTLLVQGDQDRVIPPSHAEALARMVHGSELWLRHGDGHVSVLESCPAAMDWVIAAS